LPFRDFIHGGVGVEFKLLMRMNPQADVGRSLMHPAATRTINFDETGTAEQAMRDVLGQWATEISRFGTRIAASSASGKVDARWGVLLWAPDHSQFLYFEERLEKPKPSKFYAEWSSGTHRGKRSRNLHIFERDTKKKRFSCTLPRHGAKLQPYFDIPTEQEGAIIFRVPPHRVVPFYIEHSDHERLKQLFADKSDEEIMSELLAAYVERRGISSRKS
jgi:hypothetical protein